MPRKNHKFLTVTVKTSPDHYFRVKRGDDVDAYGRCLVWFYDSEQKISGQFLITRVDVMDGDQLLSNAFHRLAFKLYDDCVREHNIALNA